MDATIISPLQQHVLPVATKNPDHALQVKGDRKSASHAEAQHLVEIGFFHLVVETLDG